MGTNKLGDRLCAAAGSALASPPSPGSPTAFTKLGCESAPISVPSGRLRDRFPWPCRFLVERSPNAASSEPLYWICPAICKGSVRFNPAASPRTGRHPARFSTLGIGDENIELLRRPAFLRRAVPHVPFGIGQQPRK